MSRFEELNLNIDTVLMKLLSSQDLCKYLFYDEDDPMSQPNIEDTSILLFDRIYPTPVSPTITDSAKSLITIIQDDFSLAQTNTAFKTSKIIFNILCHIELWRMPGTGKLRPYSILSEIDKLFNQQRVLGIGKLSFSNGRWIGVNDRWQGYQVAYKIYEFDI